MKKILFVINNLNIGGIQKSLVNLLNAIANEYDISLVVFSEEGELFNELPSNIKVIKVNKNLKVLGISQNEAQEKGLYIWSIRTLGAIWSKLFGNFLPINLLMYFCKIREKFDYGISYAQFSQKHYFSGGSNEFILNSVNCKEKITFIHCDFEHYGGNSAYTRKKYCKFDKVIACSEGTRRQFLKIIPELSSRTFVVHNFCDILKIKNLSECQPIHYKSDVLNIITVSRLSKEKALDRVIYGVEKAVKNNIKINCHIIGDGPERGKLEILVKSLKLELYIKFYGEQENPYRFMKNADLLVISSEHEAAPMIIEEAAVLNLPVFSTETISAKEMILDDNRGWICKNTTEDFIATFMKIVDNREIIRFQREKIKTIKISNDKTNYEFKQLIKN